MPTLEAEQTVINEVNVFFNKAFRGVKIMEFNRTGPTCYSAIFFLTPVPANKMMLFHT